MCISAAPHLGCISAASRLYLAHDLEEGRVGGAADDLLHLPAPLRRPARGYVRRERQRRRRVHPPQPRRQLRDDEREQGADREDDVVLVVGEHRAHGLGGGASPSVHHDLAPEAEAKLEDREERERRHGLPVPPPDVGEPVVVVTVVRVSGVQVAQRLQADRHHACALERGADDDRDGLELPSARRVDLASGGLDLRPGELVGPI
mmetsp:Transcript_32546/g.96891  ORF Transcript_32546/g.96891 Transcript_32546/m.96891 type:complete len:205 (-) Transcript_32546:346-960(-)